MRKGSFHFGRNRKALTASFTAVTYGRNSYSHSLDESEAGNIWDPSGNTPSGISYRCGFTFSLHFNKCMTLGHLNWTNWSPENLSLYIEYNCQIHSGIKMFRSCIAPSTQYRADGATPKRKILPILELGEVIQKNQRRPDVHCKDNWHPWTSFWGNKVLFLPCS